MGLNLTTSNYGNMSDTNKLLYLIYGELVQIRQVLFKAEIDSLQSEKLSGDSEVNVMQEDSTEGHTEANAMKCKYCGEMVDGNRGNLLAHIRKCPERK